MEKLHSKETKTHLGQESKQDALRKKLTEGDLFPDAFDFSIEKIKSLLDAKR